MNRPQKRLRILVIKPSSLGDVVQMLQVMEGAYRAAHVKNIFLDIHWIIRDYLADLLRMSSIISRLFLFDRKAGVFGFFCLMREVRKYRYDYVIDGQGLLRSGLMTFFAKSDVKIGRKDAREGSCLFYHKTYAPTMLPAHAVDILQALLRSFDLNLKPQRPLTLNIIVSWHFPFNGELILLFPNSRGSEKEWPYFFELTQNLLEQTPYRCVWLGQSMPNQATIQHPRFINFIGQTRLSDLPLLIQSARCIIANDSGPIHLAAALKKPLVGIYGPTDSCRYGPYPIDEHCILQAPDKDLRKISVKMVLNAVKQQLNF